MQENSVEKNLKIVALATVAGLLGFSSAKADQTIPVDHPTFDSPDAGLFVATGATSWNTVSGNDDTGVFANPQNYPAGVLGPGAPAGPNPFYISNANSSQLGYIAGQYSTSSIMISNPLTGITDTFTPTNRFFQTPSSPSAVYTNGDSYKLTVGVTSSSEEPVTSAQLLLALYYVDATNNRVILAHTIVTGTQAQSGDILMLKDFTVSLPNANVPLVNGSPAPIGILISTADSDDPADLTNNAMTGGEFDVDNVSLTFTPEPATTGVLAIGAVGLLRRRRR